MKRSDMQKRSAEGWALARRSGSPPDDLCSHLSRAGSAVALRSRPRTIAGQGTARNGSSFATRQGVSAQP